MLTLKHHNNNYRANRIKNELYQTKNNSLFSPMNDCLPSVMISTQGYIISPFKPDFTVVIFIHYKQRISVAILDLWMKITWSGHGFISFIY